MSMKWFRVYSEVLTDRKIARIAKAIQQPIPTIIGAWIMILSLANDSPERGKLLIAEGMPFSLDEILDELELGEVGAALVNYFIEFCMLSWEGDILVVGKWNERQFASDNSSPRVKRYRQRQKSETLQDSYNGVSVTPPDTETDTDSDTETEKEVFSVFLAEIGTVSPIIADDIADCIAEYSGQWVIDAIREAARANKRSWRYVLAILRNWKAGGRDGPRGQKEIKKPQYPEPIPIYNDKGEMVGTR